MNKKLPTIKTVVRVNELIAAIERKRDSEIREARASQIQYKKDHEVWLKSVREHLTQKLKKITSGFKVPSNGRWKREISE